MENKQRKRNVPSLVRRADFEKLRKLGKRVRSGSWLVLTYLKNDYGHLRCGWTIPGRSAGAVIRNRLKRWGREFFRNLPPEEKALGIDINVFIGGQPTHLIRGIDHDAFEVCLKKSWEQVRNRHS